MEEYCEEDFEPSPCESCPADLDGNCKYQYDCCPHRQSFSKYINPANIDLMFGVFNFIKEDLKDSKFEKLLDWHEYGFTLKEVIDNIDLDVGLLLNHLMTVIIEYFRILYEEKEGLKSDTYIHAYDVLEKAIPKLDQRIRKVWNKENIKFDDFEQYKRSKGAMIDFLSWLDEYRRHTYLRPASKEDEEQ